MEERKSTDNGITLIQFGKFVWKNKVSTIIVITITMILSFVCMFFVNKQSSYYSCRFRLEWNNSQSNRYPDGTKFEFSEIISKENVEYVIENTPTLNYLTIEDLLENDSTTISYQISYIDSDNKEIGTNFYYEIQTLAKNFKSKDDARLFLKELVDHQYDIVMEKTSKFQIDNLFDIFDSTTEYDIIFETINLQLEGLANTVESMIKEKTPDFIYDLANGSTLRTLKERILAIQTRFKYDSISKQYITSNFVRNEEVAKEKFLIEITSINHQLEEKNAHLKLLNSQMSNVSGALSSDAYVSTIAPIIEEINTLQTRLTYISNLSAITFNQEYDNEVNKYLTDIDKLVLDVSKAQIESIQDDVKLVYMNISIINEVETIGNILAAVISVLIGAFVGVAFAFAKLSIIRQLEQEKVNNSKIN